MFGLTELSVSVVLTLFAFQHNCAQFGGNQFYRPPYPPFGGGMYPPYGGFGGGIYPPYGGGMYPPYGGGIYPPYGGGIYPPYGGGPGLIPPPVFGGDIFPPIPPPFFGGIFPYSNKNTTNAALPSINGTTKVEGTANNTVPVTLKPTGNSVPPKQQPTGSSVKPAIGSSVPVLGTNSTSTPRPSNVKISS